MAGKKNKKYKKTKKISKDSKEFMEKLKHFVRNEGVEFLSRDNITSVGIGYKETDGEVTDEIAIQFSVEEKLEPEALELESVNPPLPKSFMIDGVEVSTDVVERDFKPDYEVVSEAEANRRKTRLDPIEPGASVAHNKSSAGTIGCIVYDRKTGLPCILSNWHVLQGRIGVLDDDVTQPGPHDDNRVDQNRVGKLMRSHLGPAGDCAIASIEGRSFVPEILDLGIGVEKLGEPELGDKVIKSGRTTNVTHGKVSRINAIFKLNYGSGVGVKIIGGFEIIPDENNPPFDGEISKGGDSGSCWLFKTANGAKTKVMAGLHFAGESRNNPNEHAVACYPKSVFEKLDITLTKPEKKDLKKDKTIGYSSDFLSVKVDAPVLSNRASQDAFELENSKVIDYKHFSLTFSMSRGFAIWVGWNIDGGNIKKVSRKGLRFKVDPRIPSKIQNGNELYSNNPIDRGHIARRADLVWGSLDEAKKANTDSFFFTNIAPQLDNFNRSNKGGIWGELENVVFAEAKVDDLRVSVFGGPVFQDDDFEYRKVKIPREFYKVIVYVEEGKLKAKAFILTQNLDGLELIDLDEFRVFQVTLTEIEQRCDFTFPSELHGADDLAEHFESQPEFLQERTPVIKSEDILW